MSKDRWATLLVLHSSQLASGSGVSSWGAQCISPQAVFLAFLARLHSQRWTVQQQGSLPQLLLLKKAIACFCSWWLGACRSPPAAYLFPELYISPATFKAFRKISRRILSAPEVAFCWKCKVMHFWMMFVMLPCYLQNMAFCFSSEIAKCIIRFNWEFVSGPKIPKAQSFGVGLWCSLGSSSVSVPGDVYFIKLLLSFPLQTAVLLSLIRSKRRNCFLFSFSFPVKLLR